jgi:choline monooxygenase
MVLHILVLDLECCFEMSSNLIDINSDISLSKTLNSNFYKDPKLFEEIKQNIFLKSWQFIGDNSQIKLNNSFAPQTILDGFLTEPIVLTRDNDSKVHCLTNVCTHRGNIVAMGPGKSKKLTCCYHGRTFNLDGSFKSMPEFEQTKNFPSKSDNLHKFPIVEWGPFLFADMNSSYDFKNILDIMNKRINFLPLDQFSFNANLSKDYLVNCHWALYCDNYLEGFHIPFVHEGLNKVLDYNNYKTVLYDHCNLQIGFSDESNEVFDFPINHIDYGKNIAAYYYWIFPNMMFNFYPWGLSINIVKPLSINKTKVSFLTYIFDDSKLHKGAGNEIDKVEREDEFIVENVNKGIQSSFYKSGRYSSTREQGVHHFHCLLAQFLN